MLDQVTVVAYFFCQSRYASVAFPDIEHALAETWRHCGKLKTVLVSNDRHGCLVDFTARHSNVELQIEASLVPGDIHTMSVDCNANLHRRFKTPYALIVQNDGYPLRPGLEEFVGKYDFIGAPYIRNVWWKNLVCSTLNYWVQNGGFSLRSKRICEAAAELWRRKYARSLNRDQAVEDLYYTKFLPLHERTYRKAFRLANNRESLRFSWDALVPIECPPHIPFGFHRTCSREILQERFGSEI